MQEHCSFLTKVLLLIFNFHAHSQRRVFEPITFCQIAHRRGAL